jgi:tetratricopeptide (TPR) repeat protein
MLLDQKLAWAEYACGDVAANWAGSLRDAAQPGVAHGEYRRAAQYYASALQLKPQFPQALNHLGAVFMNLNDTDRAIDCFQAALGLNPSDDSAKKNLAQAVQIKQNQLSAPAVP